MIALSQQCPGGRDMNSGLGTSNQNSIYCLLVVYVVYFARSARMLSRNLPLGGGKT